MSKFPKTGKRYVAKLLHKTLNSIFSKTARWIFFNFTFLETPKGLLWGGGGENPWTFFFYYSPSSKMCEPTTVTLSVWQEPIRSVHFVHLLLAPNSNTNSRSFLYGDIKTKVSKVSKVSEFSVPGLRDWHELRESRESRNTLEALLVIWHS